MADAELSARLSLDLSQFTQGMKQAEQATKQITNGLNALERETIEVQKSFNSNQQAAEALTVLAWVLMWTARLGACLRTKRKTPGSATITASTLAANNSGK